MAVGGLGRALQALRGGAGYTTVHSASLALRGFKNPASVFEDLKILTCQEMPES